MTQIMTLVGDLGGGKTTLAKVMGMIVLQTMPDAKVITNVTMGSGMTKVDDVHKFLAQKLIYRDTTYAFVIDDEAAQAGLESRGSGSKASALESRIITHARKAHVDLVLISQLKSMLDKRAQWVEDLAILCEAVFDEDNLTSLPNRFHYTVYDKALNIINEFELDTVDLIENVWPGMDTDDIPFFKAFRDQMISYYSINAQDKLEFYYSLGKEMPWEPMKFTPMIFPDRTPVIETPEPDVEGPPKQEKEWQDTRRWKAGKEITLEDGVWTVMDAKGYDTTTKKYRYDLQK
jgi:hypothetical protein